MDGTLQGIYTLVLNPYETKTIDICSTYGIPTGQTYGIIVYGTSGFSMLVASDRFQTVSCSIHPQGLLFKDTWFGMYNYTGNPPDYFYVFNPNSVSVTSTVDVYNSNGNFIQQFTVPLSAYGTKKIVLSDLVGSGCGGTTTPITVQNVGLHLTASLGQVVNVYTYLSTSWNGSSYSKNGPQGARDGYVPFPTDHNGSTLIWMQQYLTTATRITNIESTNITLIMEVWNSTGQYFSITQTVNAYGTIQIPQPAGITGSGPALYKINVLNNKKISAHTVYWDEIVTPQVTQAGQLAFWWGLNLSGTGGGSQSAVGIFNPNNFAINVIPVCYYYNPYLTQLTSTAINLSPYQCVKKLYSSIFSIPVDNATMYFSSTNNFGILVEGPNFADAEPLIGGDVFQTYGVSIEPNNSGICVPGGTVKYLHTITNVGTVIDAYNLSYTSTLGGTVLFYKDNGFGEPEGGPITQTPNLLPNGTYNIVVMLSMPSGVTIGATDITQIKVSSVSVGEIFNSATNNTEIVAPTPTSTITITMTASLTFTGTETMTNTITETVTPTITITASETITNTITQTITLTRTQTITNTITPTITNTMEISFTITQTITGTLTMTATPTETLTVIYSFTLTETFTQTILASSTITQTVTETSTIIFTETSTTSYTTTMTFTITPTFIQSLTNTETKTDTSTQTITPTMTITNTVTITPTITTTYTHSSTPTISPTHSNTPPFTATATPSITVTFTDSMTQTITSTITNTLTETVTKTITDTITMTITFTTTPTITETYTQTITSTITDTITETHTITETFTITNTYTITQTHTITPTITLTLTFTITQTPMPYLSPTITPTFTATPGQIIVYPNPFNSEKAVNGTLKIEYLPENTRVSIYTVHGFKVYYKENTNGRIEWNGKNMEGEKVAPGIYFYIIETKNEKIIGKLFITK
jgi:hypothetical protein